MAKQTDKVAVLDRFKTFDELLTELGKKSRSHIRLVKVDDQGLVEPVRHGNAFVMQPRVRVVATALDYKKKTPEILRFQKTWDVGSGKLTINAFSGRGTYQDPTGAKTRDQIIDALKARSFVVSQGEWTPESAQDALAGLATS
jgi:hypothetical protein